MAKTAAGAAIALLLATLPLQAQNVGEPTSDPEIRIKRGRLLIGGYCTFSAVVARGQSRMRMIADQACALIVDEEGLEKSVDIYMYDGGAQQYDLSYAFRLTSSYDGEGREMRREQYLYWNAMPGSDLIDQSLGFVSGGDSYNDADGACWVTKTVKLCMQLRSGRDVRTLAPGLGPLRK
jgi:hypothetical protein